MPLHPLPRVNYDAIAPSGLALSLDTGRHMEY
jgi:hypothetical protein